MECGGGRPFATRRGTPGGRDIQERDTAMRIPNRPHDSRGALRLVRVVALLLGTVLLGSSAAPGQRFEKDPVQEFRQALLLDVNKRFSDAKRGDGSAALSGDASK